MFSLILISKKSIDEKLKEDLIKKLNFYRYENADFATITKYQQNPKQFKIYYDICSVTMIEDCNDILQSYRKNLNMSELDSFDIYSIVFFDNLYKKKSTAVLNEAYF